MMKAIRAVLSVTLFAVLGISILPAPSPCQMMDSALVATGCRLPCCASKRPMRNCPFLRASAPRDLIAGVAASLDNTLNALNNAKLRLPQARILGTPLSDLMAAVRQLVFASPPPVRALPSDVHLFNA